MRKEILLLLSALLFLVLFFCIPIYNKWLFRGVLNPGTSILYQARHQSIKERMTARFSCVYTQLRRVTTAMHAAHADSALVLLPSDEYLQAHKVRCIHMPEPLVFYYFTGARAVLANHPAAINATWTVAVQSNGQVGAVKISGREQLDSLIDQYKKYLPH